MSSRATGAAVRSRLVLVYVMLVAAAACTTASDPSHESDVALCEHFEAVRQNRASDNTEVDAIHALVDVLPESHLEDAALFYYPYGGDVPANASGVDAGRAGVRLDALYEERCA